MRNTPSADRKWWGLQNFSIGMGQPSVFPEVVYPSNQGLPWSSPNGIAGLTLVFLREAGVVSQGRLFPISLACSLVYGSGPSWSAHSNQSSPSAAACIRSCSIRASSASSSCVQSPESGSPLATSSTGRGATTPPSSTLCVSVFWRKLATLICMRVASPAKAEKFGCSLRDLPGLKLLRRSLRTIAKHAAKLAAAFSKEEVCCAERDIRSNAVSKVWRTRWRRCTLGVNTPRSLVLSKSKSLPSQKVCGTNVSDVGKQSATPPKSPHLDDLVHVLLTQIALGKGVWFSSEIGEPSVEHH